MDNDLRGVGLRRVPLVVISPFTALPLVLVTTLWLLPNSWWPAWIGAAWFFTTIPRIIIGRRLAAASTVVVAALPPIGVVVVAWARKIVENNIQRRREKRRMKRGGCSAERHERHRKRHWLLRTIRTFNRQIPFHAYVYPGAAAIYVGSILIILIFISAAIFPDLWFPPNIPAKDALEVALQQQGVPPEDEQIRGHDFHYHMRQILQHACRRLSLPSFVCSPHPTVDTEAFEIPVIHPKGFGESFQRVDVFAPIGARNDANHERPVLAFFHGGGWVSSNKQSQGLSLLVELASRGWVCVSVGYRLVSPLRYIIPRLFIFWLATLAVVSRTARHRFNAVFRIGILVFAVIFAIKFRDTEDSSVQHALEDVYRGVEWTRDNAAAWGGLTSGPHGFLAGYGVSAGAHMALMASMEGPPDAKGHRENSVFDTVIAGYAPTDFHDGEWHLPAVIAQEIIAEILLKEERSVDAWAKFAPLQRLLSATRALAPSYFLIHGDADTLVPPSHSRLMTVALRNHGVNATLAEIPNANHGFDVFPTSEAGVEVANALTRFLVFKAAEKRNQSLLG